MPLHVDELIESGGPTLRIVGAIFTEKHPPSMSVDLATQVHRGLSPAHSVIFESLDASCIRSAALHTAGAVGPSGIDALGWRQMCISYESASDLLQWLDASEKIS